MEFNKNEIKQLPYDQPPEKDKKSTGKGEYRSGYAPEIIEIAKQIAKEMEASGEVSRKFPIGWESGHLWLSSEQKQVIGTEKIEVDGRVYYIGLARSE